MVCFFTLIRAEMQRSHQEEQVQHELSAYRQLSGHRRLRTGLDGPGALTAWRQGHPRDAP